jgi:hypothetical protein
VRTEAELAIMDKKQCWALVGQAKRSEIDAFSPRAAVAFRYKYMTSVLTADCPALR